MIPKLIAVIVLIMVALLSVTGCTTSQNTQQNQTAKLTDAINITAESVQSPKFDLSPLTLRPGDKYVMYNVTLTNVNARDRQVSALFFALHDSDNNVYNIDQLIQSRYLNQAFSYGYTMTQPGDKVTGRIVFEVPQNVTFVTLTYDDHSVAYNDYTGNVTIKL